MTWQQVSILAFIRVLVCPFDGQPCNDRLTVLLFTPFFSRGMSQTRLKSWVQETGLPPGCSMSVQCLWVWVLTHNGWLIISSFTLQMSDVQAGGATVFTDIGASVSPKKVHFCLMYAFLSTLLDYGRVLNWAVFGCARRGQQCSGITCIPAEKETIGPDMPPVRSCLGTSGVSFGAYYN